MSRSYRRQFHSKQHSDIEGSVHREETRYMGNQEVACSIQTDFIPPDNTQPNTPTPARPMPKLFDLNVVPNDGEEEVN